MPSEREIQFYLSIIRRRAATYDATFVTHSLVGAYIIRVDPNF